MTPARLLEAHVSAGPAGQPQSLGLLVPHPDVPAPAPEPVQTETPSEVLAALGLVPVHRARAG
ncbi:hypothetical protein [Methylorubrum extorquens]|uniref:hypothetical protein n=1 Tax=Methylorubrum extorquens TaxID=408 RepID=UPI0020A01091|nr:hypothetical protein [Methylorubrum extorquens]MCP1539779.1 hypothetical protein [Methylorubrum extorquens]